MKRHWIVSFCVVLSEWFVRVREPTFDGFISHALPNHSAWHNWLLTIGHQLWLVLADANQCCHCHICTRTPRYHRCVSMSSIQLKQHEILVKGVSSCNKVLSFKEVRMGILEHRISTLERLVRKYWPNITIWSSTCRIWLDPELIPPKYGRYA